MTTVKITTSQQTTGRSARWWHRHAGRLVLPLLLLAPAVLIAVLVSFYPIAYAINLSLHSTYFLEINEFIGLRHYLSFVQSPAGQRGLLNSLVFVVSSVGLALPLGLGLALLLNQELGPMRAVYRTLLVLPWVVAQVATALLWSWMVNPHYGPVVYLLQTLGFGAPNLLGDKDQAMWAMVVAAVWRSFPFGMLLLLAALQTVPRDIYEAAEVDGAIGWRSLWYLTLPLIKSTLLVTVIILTLSYFNLIELPYILTGGGPVGTTEVMSVQLYREAFLMHNVGYSSAIAVYIFIFNIVFSLLYIRLLHHKP